MNFMNTNPIYTIICCDTVELKTKESINPDGTALTSYSCIGNVILGDHDVFGFFHEKEIAFEAVRMNACDICEACYNYAIVEEVIPGLYTLSRNHWLFKYNRDTDEYIQVDEPEILRNKANLTWISRWCD